MEEVRTSFPSPEAIENELSRERYRQGYSRVLRSTVFYLLVVAAVVVLVAMLLLPMLQIVGNSMTETLYDGDIVVALRGKLKTGDVVAFYYNNSILIKRVIAGEGQWVDIDPEGQVSVDGRQLQEPYVKELAFGECNIELPYQVPDGKYFVMGDFRATSIDSRNTAVGCVGDDLIIGRIFLRIWPIQFFGRVR